MAAIEQFPPGLTTTALPEADERAARSTLRDQIARMERELTTACLEACPRVMPTPPRSPTSVRPAARCATRSPGSSAS